MDLLLPWNKKISILLIFVICIRPKPPLPSLTTGGAASPPSKASLQAALVS